MPPDASDPTPDSQLELRAEAAVDSIAGTASVQQWWSHREHTVLLRLGQAREDVTPPRRSELITEAQLVGLLDAAWVDGMLSDFAKRQIFHGLMRRYEEHPEALWAVGPSEDDD